MADKDKSDKDKPDPKDKSDSRGERSLAPSEPIAVERFRRLEIYGDEVDKRPVDSGASEARADSSLGVPEEKVLEDKVKREERSPPVPRNWEIVPAISPAPPLEPPFSPERIRWLPQNLILSREDLENPGLEDAVDLRQAQARSGFFRRIGVKVIYPIMALVMGGLSLYIAIKPAPPKTATTKSSSQISDDSLVDILHKLSETVDVPSVVKIRTKYGLSEKPEFAYRARAMLTEFFTIHALPPTTESIDIFRKRHPFIKSDNYFLFFGELDPLGMPFQNEYNYSKYAGKGKAGAVSVIKSEYLLPFFPLQQGECFPFFDRNAAKALAEKKGKFITSAQFAGVAGSSYFIEKNPYWDLQTLERSGGVESLLTQAQLHNPTKARLLQNEYCGTTSETYAWCIKRYSIHGRVFVVPEGVAPKAEEDCYLFSKEGAKVLISYFQREGSRRLKRVEDLERVYFDDDAKNNFDPDGDGCLEKMEKADEPRNKR